MVEGGSQVANKKLTMIVIVRHGQTTIPTSAPMPAVKAIASAPQNVTRIIPYDMRETEHPWRGWSAPAEKELM